MNSLIRKPSAWLPILMSLIVLAIIITDIAVFGVPVRQADEGTGAHLFQIWLVLEAVMVAFFTIKWVPPQPKPALVILILQILAALAACAPVYYFNL